MPPSEPARWFAEEVPPQVSALRAYLQARFPTLPDYDAIRMEKVGNNPAAAQFFQKFGVTPTVGVRTTF